MKQIESIKPIELIEWIKPSYLTTAAVIGILYVGSLSACTILGYSACNKSVQETQEVRRNIPSIADTLTQ